MFSSLPGPQTPLRSRAGSNLVLTSKPTFFPNITLNFPMIQINQLCANSSTVSPHFFKPQISLYIFLLINSNEASGFGTLYQDIQEALPTPLLLVQLYSSLSAFQPHQCYFRSEGYQCTPSPPTSNLRNFTNSVFLTCNAPTQTHLYHALILIWLILFILLGVKVPPRAHNLNGSRSGAPGWLSTLSIRLMTLAQVMISRAAELSPASGSMTSGESA